MTFIFMILECSSRREWRILTARVQALKTLSMSSLMVQSEFVAIESSGSSRAGGKATSICRGTKLSLKEFKFLYRHPGEILDKEERFDSRLVICQNISQISYWLQIFRRALK
jgi:hypothetical protein